MTLTYDASRSSINPGRSCHDGPTFAAASILRIKTGVSKIERDARHRAGRLQRGQDRVADQKVREKTGVDDWKFESYVPADGKVTFTREDFVVEVLEVEYTGGGTAKRSADSRRTPGRPTGTVSPPSTKRPTLAWS